MALGGMWVNHAEETNNMNYNQRTIEMINSFYMNLIQVLKMKQEQTILIMGILLLKVSRRYIVYCTGICIIRMHRVTNENLKRNIKALYKGRLVVRLRN